MRMLVSRLGGLVLRQCWNWRQQPCPSVRPSFCTDGAAQRGHAVPPVGEWGGGGDVLYRAKMSENRRVGVKIVIAACFECYQNRRTAPFPEGQTHKGRHHQSSSLKSLQPFGSVAVSNPYFSAAPSESGA